MQTLAKVYKSKAVRWTLLSLAATIAAGFIALYGASAWVLARTYEAPAVALRAQVAPSAERGARLAAITGCTGCHGAHGRVFFEAPFVGKIVTPDLARTQKRYSDAELVALLRTGIKRDRTSAIQMPIDALSVMADADIADVIAWLRALKPDAETETAVTSWGPIGRVLLFTGMVHLSAQMPRDPAPPVSAPLATPVAHGEYLVKVVCSQCHRLDEPNEVKPGLSAPPLRAMTQAYDLEQFTHLLRTGKGAGERELQLMSPVAREAFVHLTDEEIAALHAYLNAPN